METLRDVQDAVEFWMQNNQIEGSKDINHKDRALKDVEFHKDWLSEPKVAGNRVAKVGIFFAIKTGAHAKDSMQAQMQFLKRESAKATTKRNEEDHASRVGYLVGPAVDRVNMGWHGRCCQGLGKINGEEMELKKERVHEGEETQWCVVMRRMRSVKKKADIAMR